MVSKRKAQQRYQTRQQEPGSQPAPDAATATPKVDANIAARSQPPDRRPSARKIDRPTESPADRIERIAKEALALRDADYIRATHDYHACQDLIDTIKAKSSLEQKALQKELRKLEQNSTEALKYITEIDFDSNKMALLEKQLAALQTIPATNRTPEQNEHLQTLFDDVNDLDHRLKLFNFVKSTDAPVKTGKNEHQSQPTTEEIIAREISLKQQQDTENRLKLTTLNDELAKYEAIDIHNRTATLNQKIKTLKDQITVLNRLLPPDKQTAKTVIIERKPATSEKTAKPAYTTRELAQQEVDEDYVATQDSLDEARAQLTKIDVRLAAQDSRTIVGQRNIAELNKQRQEITTAIAEHLPTPPDIRPEIHTQLTRLDDIRFESRDLYNKSSAFLGDKAAAATAAAEIVKLNKQLIATYTPIFTATQKAYNQLTGIQRQELPPFQPMPKRVCVL